MRALNGVERSVWPTQYRSGSKDLPVFRQSTLQWISELQELSAALSKHRQITNKDFWLLSNSYLWFLKNDVAQANLKLSEVKDSQFIQQKEILAQVYEVFS